MVSLTTIYGVGASLGTIAAFVAAYVGHRIYPIQTGGTLTEVVEAVKEKASEVVDKVTETVSTPPEQPLNTDVTPLEPPVEEQPLPQVELPAPEVPTEAPVEQPVST